MKNVKFLLVILMTVLLLRVFAPVVFANNSDYIDNYHRSELSAGNQKLYDEILKNVKAHSRISVFFGDYNGTDMSQVLLMVGLDNPEISNFAFDVDVSKVGCVSVIIYKYFDIDMDAETKKVIDTYVEATKDMSDIDKISYVYNDLVGTTYETKKVASYSAYGALINKEASCEGIAKALAYFMNEAGIENHIASTTVKNVAHAYNVAVIDGVEYKFDATFDATDGNGRIDYFAY